MRTLRRASPGAMRSVRAIEHADICILIIDATRGFEGQDQSIFWLAEKNRKGVVILVNKWDLVEKDTMSTRDYEEKIRKERVPQGYKAKVQPYPVVGRVGSHPGGSGWGVPF